MTITALSLQHPATLRELKALLAIAWDDHQEAITIDWAAHTGQRRAAIAFDRQELIDILLSTGACHGFRRPEADQHVSAEKVAIIKAVWDGLDEELRDRLLPRLLPQEIYKATEPAPESQGLVTNQVWA